MIQSPKARFLANSVACKKHADTVTTAEFQEALQAALTEYTRQTTALGEGDRGFNKILGAFEFSTLLCRLHVPPTQRTPTNRDNLE